MILAHTASAVAPLTMLVAEMAPGLTSAFISGAAGPTTVFTRAMWSVAFESMAGAPTDQGMPGGGSRWNAGKDLSWVPLRIERVAEVTFGQLQSGRFRHGSTFVRWRPDREPGSCTYDQLEVAEPVPFAYDELQRAELDPFLRVSPPGPRLSSRIGLRLPEHTFTRFRRIKARRRDLTAD